MSTSTPRKLSRCVTQRAPRGDSRVDRRGRGAYGEPCQEDADAAVKLHITCAVAHLTCAILTLASLPDLFLPTYGPFLALRGHHGAPRADGWAHLMCANGRISAPYVR